jgi:GntR family transcriptional regulator
MLQITINEGEGTPLYFQLVRQIKHLIATGRLASGEDLPPVRVLAQQLLINPNTVVRAYRELESAGLVYTRRGAGTYVADGRVPYSDEECRRILSDRLDGLVVDARNLGFSLERLVELLKERDKALRGGGDSLARTEGVSNGIE